MKKIELIDSPGAKAEICRHKTDDPYTTLSFRRFDKKELFSDLGPGFPDNGSVANKKRTMAACLFSVDIVFLFLLRFFLFLEGKPNSFCPRAHLFQCQYQTLEDAIFWKIFTNLRVFEIVKDIFL